MVGLPHTFSSEPLYKEQFATFLYQGFTPFLAAMKIWPNDTGFAYSIGEMWPNDPYVQECIGKLRKDADERNKPPSKELQIKRLEARMHNMRDEDYLKAERLIAEMSGHIEKAAAAQVNVQNNTFDKVMIVRDHGSDDEWAEKTRRQQELLINGN